MVTEESTKDTVKTIVQGMPAVAVYPWLLTRVLFAARGLGCNAHPAFPAPSSDLRAARFQHLGHFVPRECGCMFPVIASEAKQSRVACSAVDCFAEPVIGCAFARPVGIAGRTTRPPIRNPAGSLTFESDTRPSQHQTFVSFRAFGK